MTKTLKQPARNDSQAKRSDSGGENEELKKEIKRLKQFVLVDFLTRVLNRLAFQDILKNACREINYTKTHKSRRQNPPIFSLLLIDLDDFKKYNDKHGHLSGDRVLKQVAKIIRETVREIDTVARWGGEEFVILLRGAKLPNAKLKAEIVLKQIREKTPITASIGAVQTKVTDTPHQIFKRADRALYHAKKSGKDQVVCLTK